MTASHWSQSSKTRYLLLVLSALLTAISFAPYRLGFVAYFSLALFLQVLEGRSPKEAFGDGYLWGVVFNFGILYGVFWATIPGTIGAVVVISLIPAINACIYRFVAQRSRLLGYVVWPALWLGWDYLRTLTELNFPWADLGYSQSYYLPLIQPAEIFGVYGISLVVHAVNVLLFAAWQLRGAKPRLILVMLIAAALLPAVLFVYGLFRLPPSYQRGTFRVAIAQGNIGPDVKWRPEGVQYSESVYFALTREAAAAEAKLVIWPETALPFYLLWDQPARERVKRLVRSCQLDVLTGIPHYEPTPDGEYIYFNSAVLLSPQHDTLQLYSKIKLVPMSERIPFSGRYKKLRDIHLGQADFSSGENMTIMHSDGIPLATVICFESAFPAFCAEFCRRGARFLVIITNDMWFGPSSLPYQHARMAVLRAVENRVPIVRCANTGISMFVDKWGRVDQQTKMFERKLIIGDIEPTESNTLYNRHRDWLPRFCLALSVILIAVAFLLRHGYNGGGTK